MHFFRTEVRLGLIGLSFLCAASAHAADLVVSAQDGKFVRVEGKATYPQPAPPDSLVVIDMAQSPPAIVATLEGLEHTVQGPPQAVAITPDGKLAVVAAPTRYDYDAKKELYDHFLQIVDLEASPPKLLGSRRRPGIDAFDASMKPTRPWFIGVPSRPGGLSRSSRYLCTARSALLGP